MLKIRGSRTKIVGMIVSVRNQLILLGALWGFVLALAPALVAFEDPFTLSPFLVSAFLRAALSGAAGTVLAGRLAVRLPSGEGWLRKIMFALPVGALQGLVTGILATLSIWLAMAVNMSGFSVASPARILRLVESSALFQQSFIVAFAVFVYSLIVAILLSPVSGTLVSWTVRARSAA